MVRLVVICLVLVAPPALRPLLAADGSLDPSFGTGGIVTYPFFIGAAIVRLPDGKLLVGGGGASFSLARLHADGSLDTSFGVGGQVSVTGDDERSIGDLVLQPDGKVIAIGYAGPTPFGPHQIHIVRFNADGTVDMTYGVGGKVTANFAGGSTAGNGALLPDGRLQVSGIVTNGGGLTYDMALARFTSAGSPDATFGTGGQMVNDFSDIGAASTDLVLEPDGRFYVVGYATTPLPPGPGQVGYDTDYIVVHHNADGSLDTAFGDSGRVLTSFQDEYPYEIPTALLQQPDGKLVVAGASGHLFALARYNPDGSLDAGFGDGGKAVIPSFAVVAEPMMARQPDGKLLIAGTAYRAPEDMYQPQNFALMRLNADGSVDATFAPCPQVSTNVGEDERPTDVLLQPDGTLLVLGRLDPSSGFALARYGTAATPSCQPALGRRSALRIRNSADPDRDLLKWRWKGAAVAPGDFGDPTADTGYTLCVLDQTSGAARLRVGSPMMQFDWIPTSTGFAFKTQADNDFPFTRAKLQALPSGAGKIKLLAKGEYLVPDLPLTTPVIVRLVRDDAAACWEATFSNSITSSAEQFSAKSD